MKVTEKLQLIENIAIELQSRYTFDVINIFFKEFKVNPEFDPSYNSKRLYSQDRLKGVEIAEIVKIAKELDIDTDNVIKEPPKNWENTSSVKAFISHTSKDKANAKKLRDALKGYNVDGFVAHEDIKPSEEWQEEIRKALNSMDIFISMHTTGFSGRIWCQQEIGYAAARNIKMIPIKFDEDPEGFIAKIQALTRGKKTASDIASDIVNILKNDDKTKELYSKRIESSITDDDEIPF
tara:strand:+ start:22726 stop:23436 length:711 start_codon:yes stop_codon:yes gene_type:complete